MGSKWRVLGPLALGVGSLVTGGGAAAAQSAQSEPQPSVQSFNAEAQKFLREASKLDPSADTVIGKGLGTSGTEGTVSAQALPSGQCYAKNLTDPQDVVRLDARNYGLGYDCYHHSWTLDVKTRDSWAIQDLAELDLLFDSNNNVHDGCNGGDWAYLVGWDGASVISGGLRTPSCDSNTWQLLPESVGYFRPNGNEIWMGIPTSRFESNGTLHWQAVMIDQGDTTNAQIDFMPNGFMDEGHYNGSPGVPQCGGRCFFLSNTLGGAATTTFRDYEPANQIFFGDWDNNGTDTPGYRDGNTFKLKNSFSPTAPDITFSYGAPSDGLLVGDWNGDGIDTMALRRGNTYYIRNSLSGGGADQVVAYGAPSDKVLVGDWDGNGTDTLAVRRGNTYYVKNTISGGNADIVFAFGTATDQVFSGDWDGDGDDTLGVRRNNTYFLKNAFASSSPTIQFAYGKVTDIHLIGDFNNDAKDTIGIRR